MGRKRYRAVRKVPVSDSAGQAGDFTLEDLLADLARGVNDDDGVSVYELRRHTGITRPLLNLRIRDLVTDQMVAVGFRWMADVTGRQFRCPVYRLTEAGRARVAARRAAPKR